jgi:hypothetical protein
MEDRARVLERRIEDLTREIAKTISDAEVAGPPGIRGELRDFVITLLNEALGSAEVAAAVPITNDATPFNPIGMGIPILLAGVVLLFLFPPVGISLFAVAVALIAWGLVASLVTRR